MDTVFLWTIKSKSFSPTSTEEGACPGWGRKKTCASSSTELWLAVGLPPERSCAVIGENLLDPVRLPGCRSRHLSWDLRPQKLEGVWSRRPEEAARSDGEAQVTRQGAGDKLRWYIKFRCQLQTKTRALGWNSQTTVWWFQFLGGRFCSVFSKWHVTWNS